MATASTAAERRSNGFLCTGSNDLRADARGPGAGERVVDAGAAARLALHGAERAGREEPLVQPGPRVPERGVQALPLAGAEPVQRYREVVHPHLRHDDLLSRCLAAARTRCREPAASKDDLLCLKLSSAPVSAVPRPGRQL